MKIDLSKYYKPKSKQELAHRCRVKFVLFGGALGGGKSWWLCAEAIKNAMMFPGNRLLIVRKELTVLRRTTLVSFRSICPPEIIKAFNQSSLEVTFINGSVLTFMEADQAKDPLLQKLKGMEIGWFGIDEANEVTENVYRILITRLRWVLPSGSKPRYEGRLTSNPEQCWLIPTFIHSTSADEVYIQSLTTDNYSHDDQYVKQLEMAFKENPVLLRKYLHGDWTASDSINQLISNIAIEKAKDKLADGLGSSLGVDVARYGNDKTVFTLIINGNIELVEFYDYTSTNEIVTRTIQLINDYNIFPGSVGIDSVGVGSGVVDNNEIQGGAAPIKVFPPEEDAFKPYNLRAQMYYRLKKDIEEGKLGGLTYTKLIHELPAIRYEIASDKKVKILGKDAVKKLLGHSPDFADSLAYANWARVHPEGFPFYVPFVTIGD